MDGTIITQGHFVSAGTTSLAIRSDVDWMRIYNMTEAAAANNGHGVEYYWQRNFAANDGLVYLRVAPAINMSTSVALAVPGFNLYDTSGNPDGALVVTTASSAVAAPVVLTADTTGFVAFDTVVRLNNIVAAPTICGIDFTIQAVNPGVSFTLPILANAIAAGAGGFYKVIAYNPLFYPRSRTVCNITAAVNPTVTTTVNHGYTIGQKVRFMVPASCGMTQLTGIQATVLTLPALNTFTIDVSTVGMTAFEWPLIAAMPTSYAQVVPIGEEAHADYANLLDDATLNTGVIGITLGTGITSPAGTADDVIWWVAGKSFNM